MDSENIIQIVQQQPYHIDSLIQLSELCTHTAPSIDHNGTCEIDFPFFLTCFQVKCLKIMPWRRV